MANNIVLNVEEYHTGDEDEDDVFEKKMEQTILLKNPDGLSDVNKNNYERDGRKRLEDIYSS